MTHTNRAPYYHCKYDHNLPRLDEASPNSIYPQGRQGNFNGEEAISQLIFPTHTWDYDLQSDDELALSFDVIGCSTNHYCRNRSANTEMSDCDEYKFEQVQVSISRSFTGIIDVPTNLDGGLNFEDFELFDSRCEEWEEFHDLWLEPSMSTESSKPNLDDNQSCKSFDRFDTSRSSEMSLYHENFCSPPPNSWSSSWSINDESMISLPKSYPGDYVEASNSEFIVGVGQWICGTVVEPNDLEDES
ncbi:hypothetical protein BPOR_0146g00080 [Botrytis porri]|uniref:Uncharacterized protein n=1 Tax=Botrytis porri TaxID=87229 RepID=A0A4Z1KW05_9HELO|nr:hypothetical protein BPOR_0146g00080 [Botrytis porri]